MSARKKPFSDRTQQLAVIGLFVLATISLVGSLYLTSMDKKTPDFIGLAFTTMIAGLAFPLGMNILSQQQRDDNDKL